MEFSKMNITDEKLSLIEKKIYDKKLPLLKWQMRSAKFNKDNSYSNYSKYKTISLGDKWTCRFDEAIFLETSFVVPKELKNQRLVLDLDLGGEGLVYINGEAKGSIAFYYNPGQSVLSGVTRFRRRIDVCEKAQENKKYDVLIELNINYKDYFKSNRFLKYEDDMTEEYMFNSASVCAVNKEVEAYYFDLKNLIDTIKLLDTPAHLALERIQTCKLDLAFDRLLRNMNRDDGLKQKMLELVLTSMSKVSYFNDEEFNESIRYASLVLKEGLKKLPKVERGTVFATGFSHVDLVWLWQIRHTIRKLENTFLNAISLIERYPDYIFTFSQPYAFELIEEYHPELFKKIKKYIKEGRINIVGNAYVEMDTNVTGGEAIVRQLLYGRNYYLEKFSKDSDVFFMPDSFGFSAALPQIIKKSGIKYFFTDKLAAFNETYRFPHTFFLWQGIDGTKLPSYLERCSYNGCLNPERIDEAYGRNENKKINDSAYVTFGYGDGGGGADYVMAENYSRLKDMPGLPKVQMATVSDFFKQIKEKDSLPIWNDELYLDGHRGTYTTHGDIKKYNRQAELGLRQLEIASWIREKLTNKKYPKEEIKKLWKTILPMQFHDSLPGTCISQVYVEFKKEYELFFEKLNKLTKEVLDDISANIKHEDGEKIAYNFLSWERKDLVSNQYVSVPSIGYSVIKNKNEKNVLKASTKMIENKFFKIKFDDNGSIENIILKNDNRSMLKAKSNVFELFDDPSCARMSAWDLNKEYQNAGVTLNKADKVELVSNDGKKAILRTRRTFNNSTLEQDIIVYSDLKRIDFKTKVDWHENMKLLKVAFYPNVTTSKATYEIQFGAIERPTHRNNEYDAIRFEACGHKWADMSQSDCGLAILNDCKYGYDAYDGRLRLTLLRSPLEPDYKADRGINEFTYAIYPHYNSWQDGKVVNEAFELNVPVIISDTKQKVNASVPNSFVLIDNKNIILETIKKAEEDDAYIFRLYEANGGGGKTTVKVGFDIKEVVSTNLMEQEEKKIKVKDNSFTFEARPYEIYSFKVR